MIKNLALRLKIVAMGIESMENIGLGDLDNNDLKSELTTKLENALQDINNIQNNRITTIFNNAELLKQRDPTNKTLKRLTIWATDLYPPMTFWEKIKRKTHKQDEYHKTITSQIKTVLSFSKRQMTVWK